MIPAALCGVLLTLAAAAPARAGHGISVEVWTDQGNDAVYHSGDPVEVSARTSDDAHVLVYEIDTEGYVRLLFPYRGSSDFIEGRQTYKVPPEQANLELVAEGATGQGYIVAIASREPFKDMPWYLRPYDMQAEDLGYDNGDGDEDEGITKEGRIVGDPFVAMERIRRKLLDRPDDGDDFASAYTSYYIGEKVRYPRYLCYDCHRPAHYAWWDGFDPYYTTCSAFSFRVNWNWYWGPAYWTGYVPYYVYVYLPTCPPAYHVGTSPWYSSWDGYGKWRSMWNGPLTRYKGPAPVGYVPPDKYRDAAPGRTPPGYMGGWRVGAQPTPLGRYRSTGMRVRDGISVLRNGERVPVRQPEGGRLSPSDRTGERERPGGEFGRSGETAERPPIRIERKEAPQRPEPPAPRHEGGAEKPKDGGNSGQSAPPPPPPRIEVPRQAAPGRGAGDGGGGHFKR